MILATISGLSLKDPTDDTYLYSHTKNSGQTEYAHDYELGH